MTGHVSSSGFTFDGSTITVQAGAFIVGQQYKIATIGTTTDWNLAAGTNGLTYAAGTIFTAVTVGSGDGTVTTLVNKIFNTTISGDFINTQTATQLTADTDEIMIYRPIVVGSSQPNPYKITKADFLSNLSLVPVGSIFPFAGSVVPPGYLLCDGSEKSTAQYHLLFDVVGTTYTPNPNNLVGVNTFRLPDLRGRFPLGLLNMDNGDTVKDGGGNNINSGGGDPTGEVPSTPRVTASTASTVGNTSGSEQITLAVSQLPDHQHNLVGNTGGQYFAINNNTQAPSDQDSELLSISGNNSVQALPHSGGVKSSTVAQPVSIANPYLTINYIIYSGVHS
jgi:microcystin-dependent protein